MYILTNRLVKLRSDELPLPWYHRAPLGLMSGTPVHVALQARDDSDPRPFGDVIVSVVDPENWPFVTEVSASRTDEPGVLADVYTAAPPLNIVFAEAITVDSGSRHDVRMVLEPYYRDPREKTKTVDTTVKKNITKLKSSLEDNKNPFDKPDVRPIHPKGREPFWMDVGNIRLGWVHVEGLGEAMQAQAAGIPDADMYDLNTAVISADTERRMLRYVFPRKGAVSVTVKHSDRPGALAKIADALAGHRLNILSSLLRRGSVPARKAELVLVVEPTDDTHEAKDVEQRVYTALDGLPYTLRVRVKVVQPIDPEEVLYPRRPNEIAVRPSLSLGAEIRSVQAELPPGRRPIFISRRYVNLADEENVRIVKELRNVLKSHECIAVEALPRPGTDGTAADAVKAKMWASEGAILLVTSMRASERQFSENLAHECGFMQGQGKPVLPLIEQGVVEDVIGIANLQGLQYGTFTSEGAMDHDRGDSIHQAVQQWMASQFLDEDEEGEDDEEGRGRTYI